MTTKCADLAKPLVRSMTVALLGLSAVLATAGAAQVQTTDGGVQDGSDVTAYELISRDYARSAAPNRWTTLLDPASQRPSAVYCGTSNGARGFCFELGCNELGETYIALLLDEVFLTGTDWVIELSIDNAVLGTIAMGSPRGGQALSTRLGERLGDDLRGRLSRGNRAALRLDESFGREALPIDLGGSADSIDAVEATCPAPQ